VLASGCASNVTLEPPTIPAPLIEKVPMSVALRIPEEFQHYVHEDEVLGREQWVIDLGSSNAALFSQLFAYMFENVTILGPGDDATLLDIDALIEPSIDAFEFSVPSQSRTDAYAVWIRYRLKIYDNAGAQHASWPLAAYGKSEQTGLTGSEPLKRAAVLAMRDAGSANSRTARRQPSPDHRRRPRKRNRRGSVHSVGLSSCHRPGQWVDPPCYRWTLTIRPAR
jgi:hypothetical protein